MKKLLWPMVAVIIGFASVEVHATCAPTDIMCYVVGAVQRFRVTTAGNTTVGGTLTVTGASTHTGAVTNSNTVANNSTVTNAAKTVYTPTSQVTVATNVPVGITATYMVIKSTALIVTYGQVGRIPSDGPAISTATATDGQYLILASTTSVDTVVITTGIATAVYSPSEATITISAVKNPMAFIFDGTLSVWRAIGKQ